MKIATLNVRNLYDPGTFIDEREENPVEEHFFLKRIDYFTSFFQDKDLDIICLQEIGGEKGIKEIAAYLDYDYALAKPNKRGIRVGVLYKKSLGENIVCTSTSLGELYIPSLMEEGDTKNLPPIVGRREVLAIDGIKIGDKEVRIITMHLKSLIPEFLEGESDESGMKVVTDAKFRSIFIKMMELRALRWMATKAIDEGKEIIILGDFNENNNSSGLDVLKAGRPDMYLLHDVFVGYEGDKTTHYHKGNRLTFDTMIVSSGIKNAVTCVKVHNELLKDCSVLGEGEIEYVIEPDHAMVEVEVMGH